MLTRYRTSTGNTRRWIFRCLADCWSPCLQVASKCESFAITLLDKCTTKHEIQTLLQTKWVWSQPYFSWLTISSRSYRGHHDANFNVAILDGHKEIVAHEKFQQLLHKKWGQRDKIHYGDDIRCSLPLLPLSHSFSLMSKTDKNNDTQSTKNCDIPKQHLLPWSFTSQVQHLLEWDE